MASSGGLKPSQAQESSHAFLRIRHRVLAALEQCVGACVAEGGRWVGPTTLTDSSTRGSETHRRTSYPLHMCVSASVRAQVARATTRGPAHRLAQWEEPTHRRRGIPGFESTAADVLPADD